MLQDAERAVPRGLAARFREAPEPRVRASFESLDFAILRAWSDATPGTLGFDPRTSPEAIAHQLGVNAATVRRRLASWRAKGFFRGFDVLPHPALLGCRLATCSLDFPGPIPQERALEPLSLIDGVVQVGRARTLLSATYFVDSEVQAARRLQQFRALDGVKEVGPELPFTLPPCALRMTRSDWRLVRALRRDPEARLSLLAEDLGRSSKSTSRRMNALLDSGAVMFDPIFEFAHFHQTLAVLIAYVDRPERRADVERELLRLHPESLRSVGPSQSDRSGEETPAVHLWVTAPTTAELDEFAARGAHVPGVREVQLWYGSSTLPIRAWLDERIDATLRAFGASS